LKPSVKETGCVRVIGVEHVTIHYAKDSDIGNVSLDGRILEFSQDPE